MDKQIIYAMTGEVEAGDKDTILKSGAIGSCIVITAYDKHNLFGAMAHIMLPGKAPENKNTQKTKYTKDAIDELINLLKLNGATENIEVCLAGGANVLKRKDDNIAQNIIDSVLENLKNMNIEILAKSLGGTTRRSVSLDVETGCVYITVGDGTEEILWNFSDKIFSKKHAGRK